jgi:biopolymer transport protein ExbB
MLGKIYFRIFVLVGILAVVLAIIFAVKQPGTGGQALSEQTLFSQFVVSGGPVVWFVLLPMSLATVYLAVEHFLSLSSRRLLSEDIPARIVEHIRRFGTARLEADFAETEDLVGDAVVRAVSGGRGDWFRMRNILFESLEERAVRLMRKIEWMNLIGNVSPMVGLFGTVFGMIKLFNSIVSAGGQPKPAHLAEGISIALVTTFWGLLIAIPALTLHGIFRNRIEGLVSDATLRAEEILLHLARHIKPSKSVPRPPRKKYGDVPEIREVSPKPGMGADESMPVR